MMKLPKSVIVLPTIFIECLPLSPSQIKNANINRKAYPRMTFQIQIKGDCEMNYRIEEKSEFKAFGVEKEIMYINHYPKNTPR